MRALALPFFILLLIASCSNPEPKQLNNTATVPGTALSTDSPSATATAIPVDPASETASNTKAINVSESETSAAKSDFLIEVFENKDGTGGFGYDLLSGGKVTIHQPHIPAVSGTSGFSSKEDAEKVGSLMLMKIQKGIMPPTITVAELDSLGIKH